MSRSTGDPNLPIETLREALTVRRVFGEAYTVGETTVIPVARVIGGSGMGFGSGSGRDPHGSSGEPNAEGSGGGGGVGMCAWPSGSYVVRGDEVTWKPAFDLNLAVAGAQALAGVVAVSVACALRAKFRRRMF
ncbi:spore germination protein GerW family protein [Ruania alba]|uniref:Sporulation protein YtfJ (Spore_YtfJ) n=1 Tax=Ruania alba TaxID=648782 RepID=A0A1H5KCZ1_9MICO|nr:spore germination protein GerW family protein [Ruania alba]SEE62672.1 Sporulation protein YtfJ (Spore_YtfJ) [Ruania alba]